MAAKRGSSTDASKTPAPPPVETFDALAGDGDDGDGGDEDGASNDDSQEAAPSQEATTNLEVPSRQTVNFVAPQRDPDDWDGPSREQGMYPGDPNVYPDPDNAPWA